MTTPLERAHRLIAQDEKVRASRSAPSWPSVNGLLEYITKEKLLEDPAVRNWLATIGGSADLYVSRTLLEEAVVPLLSAGAVQPAHVIYRRVLGLDDARRWELVAPGLVQHDALNDIALDRVLASPSLLVDQPATWGYTAIELLVRLVEEHQRHDWPSSLRFHEVLADQLRQPFDPNQPFELKHDDGPDVWYFGREDRTESRCVVAQHVEQALREAAALQNGEVFQVLADKLATSGFAIAIGLLLSVLLDCINGELAYHPWHGDQATGLLLYGAVQQNASLSSLRRLLRAAIVPPPALPTAQGIAQLIRDAEHLGDWRYNELADLASWGVLTEDEERKIAQIKEKGELYAPIDRRKEPAVRRSGLIPTRPRAQPEWSHREDHEYIEELSKLRSQPNLTAPSGEFEADLMQRLAGLKVVLSREESKGERWRGEILGWCHAALTDLKYWRLLQFGRDPRHDSLSTEEWQELLQSHAPWWQSQVENAIENLRAGPPEDHRKGHTGSLAWGSNDPILQSLSYLDEVLAVEAPEPFAKFQQMLSDSIDDGWNDWPPFTRATTVCVLRPWYWHRLGKLRRRLEAIVEYETDPVVMQYGLQRLMDVTSSELPRLLGRLLERAMSIPELSETVRHVALQLGFSHMAFHTAEDSSDVSRSMSAIYEAQQDLPDATPDARNQFITGVLWGATRFLKGKELNSRHADGWSSIVAWAIEKWPLVAESDNERFPFTPITVGMKQAWPSVLRRRLYDNLADGLLHILRDGSLGDFCGLHFELSEELGRPAVQGKPTEESAHGESPLSDSMLIRLCEESVERVARWRTEGKWTRDLGWGSGLSGHDTAKLMHQAFENASDRNYFRRLLPRMIDRLADAGCTQLAAELRVWLRRQ
jgi:hypothetical protein